MEKSILLIDMNAYFASVEQQCNPLLRGKPVLVCGEGRTIVTTCSYEARAYGVKTAMTVYEAKKLCPHAIPVIGNLNKYVDTSLKIHEIMLEFTDKVEVFSIDECFMDVTDIVKFYGSDILIAQKIKDNIRKRLGLLCSAGVGPNKPVAKIAAKMHKPDGLTVLRQTDIDGVFSELPVEKLQGVGIGRKVSEKLRSLGINTAKELGDASLNLLTAHFGIMGIVYKKIGDGSFDSPVHSYYDNPDSKSVGHSYTLPKDTTDLNVAKSYLYMLCEKTAARLQDYKMMGKTVMLIVRFSDFKTHLKRYSLKHYIHSGKDIYDAAAHILDAMMIPTGPIRLVGVSITNLSKSSGQQFLFEEDKKKERLIEAVHSINSKYGEFTVKPTSLIRAEKFGMLEKCGLFGKYLWDDRKT